MKKLTKVLACLMAMVILATGCTSTNNQESEPAEPPKDENVLIMATEGGFAPYEYYKGTEIVGVDVDIAKEVAAAMGKELQVVDMEFAAILGAVETGRADFGAAGISITEERKEQVDFTIEYVTSKQVFVVLATSEVESIEDLNGATVGVQLGTIADFELEEVEGITVQQYNKYLEAMNDLTNGRIAAIGMDILPAQELVKANDQLKIVEKEFLIDNYAFAVKKGNTELLEQINEVLEKLISEGKIESFIIEHAQ